MDKMKIIKRMYSKKHKRQVILVGGITGKTLVDDIAKKYSKNYYVGMTQDMEDGKLMLWKRDKPLKKPIMKWYEWA